MSSKCLLLEHVDSCNGISRTVGIFTTFGKLKEAATAYYNWYQCENCFYVTQVTPDCRLTRECVNQHSFELKEGNLPWYIVDNDQEYVEYVKR